MSSNKIHGAIIMNKAGNIQAAIAMLTFRLRNRIEYVYYNRPQEIEPTKQLAFVIVASLDDLADVVHRYENQGYIPPPLIHLIESGESATINYNRMFPGIEIFPIEQANLDFDPDTTLQFSAFEAIVERLRAEDSETGV